MVGQGPSAAGGDVRRRSSLPINVIPTKDVDAAAWLRGAASVQQSPD
jgi:hypothetical protein